MLLVAGCQNRLLYQPRVSAEAALLHRAGELGVQPWRDAAGRLIGWREPNSAARARLLVFHDNAIDAVERAAYLQAFNALGGGTKWETFVMEYPGYGARPGKLGCESFLAAGRSAVAELRMGDQRPVFLLGESLGSGTRRGAGQRASRCGLGRVVRGSVCPTGGSRAAKDAVSTFGAMNHPPATIATCGSAR